MLVDKESHKSEFLFKEKKTHLSFYLLTKMHRNSKSRRGPVVLGYWKLLFNSFMRGEKASIIELFFKVSSTVLKDVYYKRQQVKFLNWL